MSKELERLTGKFDFCDLFSSNCDDVSCDDCLKFKDFLEENVENFNKRIENEIRSDIIDKMLLQIREDILDNPKITAEQLLEKIDNEFY